VRKRRKGLRINSEERQIVGEREVTKLRGNGKDEEGTKGLT
jgi:hypothetical protein